jgi:hypothetical protein
MANITYDSPASLRPEDGWKPQGFLGGMVWDQRDRDYRQAVQTDQQMKSIDLQNAIQEQEQSKLDLPVKAAKREGDIAKAQSLAQTAIPQAQATLETTQLANTKARAVQPDEIAESALKIRNGLDTEKQMNFDRTMSQMEAVGPQLVAKLKAAKPGLEQQTLYDAYKQQFPEAKLPDQLNIDNLEQHTQTAKLFKDKMQERALAKDTADNKAKQQVAETEANARLGVARIQEEWHKAQIGAVDGKMKSIDLEIAKANKEIIGGKDVAKNQLYIQQLQKEKDVTAAQKQLIFGQTSNLLGGVPATAQGAGAAASQAATAVRGASGQVQAPGVQPGSIQDGYRFNGGDPADKTNWEKQ